MSQNLSFRRKVLYIAAIGLLLIPLYRLGQPATRNGPGGTLAQVRAEYDLSQAELGEIDPASESMRLATLGLRGVAANRLWVKSLEYDKKEDWDKLRVTLNQITKLQPNFIKVWEFQAHNLSYNISVEFDDYRMRYHWVKKGISFLKDGTRYNRDNPRLLHYAGWITGQKIGRADEHTQFRQMFRKDNDFHDELATAVTLDEESNGYDGKPDNWLVGRKWYQRAQLAVDIKGLPLRGKSPLLFHADAPMSLINYAGMIEEEGILGKTAQDAWSRAGENWGEYGQRQIPTSWGHSIRLGDLPTVRDEIKKMEERLETLAPGVRAAIRNERIAALSPQEREALQFKMEEIREEADYRLRQEADLKTLVTHRQVAERAPAENRERALRLAERLEDQAELSYRIEHYQRTVNYEYWQTRCKVEQTKTAVDARDNLFRAKQAHRAARLEEARALYETSWKLWRQVFDLYPSLMDDITAEELVESVQHYQRLLSQLDEPLPEDFVLREFMERRHQKLDRFFAKPTPSTTTPPGEAKPSEGKPSESKPRESKPETPAKPEIPAKAAEPAASEAPPEPMESPADAQSAPPAADLDRPPEPAE